MHGDEWARLWLLMVQGKREEAREILREQDQAVLWTIQRDAEDLAELAEEEMARNLREGKTYPRKGMDHDRD